MNFIKEMKELASKETSRTQEEKDKHRLKHEHSLYLLFKFVVTVTAFALAISSVNQIPLILGPHPQIIGYTVLFLIGFTVGYDVFTWIKRKIKAYKENQKVIQSKLFR